MFSPHKWLLFTYGVDLPWCFLQSFPSKYDVSGKLCLQVQPILKMAGKSGNYGSTNNYNRWLYRDCTYKNKDLPPTTWLDQQHMLGLDLLIGDLNLPTWAIRPHAKKMWRHELIWTDTSGYIQWFMSIFFCGALIVYTKLCLDHTYIYKSYQTLEWYQYQYILNIP